MEPNAATAFFFFLKISFIFNHVPVCEGVYDMVKASNVAAGNRKNTGPLDKAMGSCCSRNIVQGSCLILGVSPEGSCSASRWQNMCLACTRPGAYD